MFSSYWPQIFEKEFIFSYKYGHSGSGNHIPFIFIVAFRTALNLRGNVSEFSVP